MRTTFTTSEDQFIKDNYLTMPIKTMARKLGRSGCGVSGRMKFYKLEVPKALADQRRKDSLYKKGRISFNKGKKQTDYMTPEGIAASAKTRFKKGDMPHNTIYKELAVVCRADSCGRYYQFIKIAHNNWKFLHRFIWEQQNGPIPKKHRIVFKDGNTLNTEIENLKLISYEEHMLRNSKNKYPEEIIPSLVLLNKLNKKLKQITNG